MSKCIEHMMEEHRLIVAVLGSFDLFVEQLAGGAAVPREHLRQFVQFFRDFADRAHHGKEEHQLFRKMIEVGFPRQTGPLGVMLSEHDGGRARVRELADIAAKHGPLSAAEAGQVAAFAREFIVLLRLHIHKEDKILYPMAQQYIPASGMQELDTACAQFDQESIGQAELQRLKSLAAELQGAYPAAPDRLAEITAHLGCGGGGCGH